MEAIRSGFLLDLVSLFSTHRKSQRARSLQELSIQSQYLKRARSLRACKLAFAMGGKEALGEHTRSNKAIQYKYRQICLL